MLMGRAEAVLLGVQAWVLSSAFLAQCRAKSKSWAACRSKKGPAVQRGNNAEDILAMLSSGESVHKVPLTLEGGVARVMKKLLDQARPMLFTQTGIPSKHALSPGLVQPM